MIKLKDLLFERIEQTKIFNSSTVNKVVADIRKITGIKDGYNTSVDYKEFRFGDGSGRFTFTWEKSRHWGGNFGLSLRKNGNHEFYCRSWYDKKYFGKQGMSANLKSKAATWKELTDADLLQLWKKAKSMMVKNEKESQKALDAEAKAQSDYYGSKAKTGRIGYGLTQQPRSRR